MKRYSEGAFEVGVSASQEGHYKVHDPAYQAFKLHFQCLNPSEEDWAFLEGLVGKRTRKRKNSRLAPCFKLFNPAVLSGRKPSLELNRLQGYASGTIYLADFGGADANALAELCLSVSARYREEDISSLDYGAAFLPYCPGVYLRQSFFMAGSLLRKSKYVSAVQADKALLERTEDPGAYRKLLEAIEIRSELRNNPMYSHVAKAIHERKMCLLETRCGGSRKGKPQAVVNHAFKPAARKLMSLMKQYRNCGYYGSSTLLDEIRQAEEEHPLLLRGVLAASYQAFKGEIARAMSFWTMRRSYKERMDAWIREECARSHPRLER